MFHNRLINIYCFYVRDILYKMKGDFGRVLRRKSAFYTSENKVFIRYDDENFLQIRNK